VQAHVAAGAAAPRQALAEVRQQQRAAAGLQGAVAGRAGHRAASADSHHAVHIYRVGEAEWLQPRSHTLEIRCKGLRTAGKLGHQEAGKLVAGGCLART